MLPSLEVERDMSSCEQCGRLFLDGREGLLLVEIEDRWGAWSEWLCERCCDQLLDQVQDDPAVEWVRLFGFVLDRTG